MIRNVSPTWNRFANGTFEIGFEDTSKLLDNSNYSITLVSGSSNLKTAPMTGNRPPADAYVVVPNIRPDRVSIVVSGPDSIADCAIMPIDTDIRLGSFILRAADGIYLSNRFAWRLPIFERQACAFKLETDSMLTEYIKYANAANNLEMDDNSRRAVRYIVDSGKDPVFDIEYFNAVYANNRRVELLWRTISEAYNKGYIITRGIKPYGETSTVGLAFPDTILDYRQDVRYKGHGTTLDAISYVFDFDTVQYRGEEYCYQLLYQDMRDGGIYPLDTACVIIPSSVITHAEANPNPFREFTDIEYKVDDDVYMTAKVYNLLGGTVETLLDNQPAYKIRFTSDYKAMQGLYEVVFTATPVDDPSIESSVAVVKMQLIK
jgi:hypothetical protein